MIGYLNINSLRNKLTDLRVILKHLSLDYFVLSEMKLDESFPNAQWWQNQMVTKSEQEGIETNSGEVSLSMFEKVWSVKGLLNMSWNIVCVYVPKLLSLKKVGHFQYL